MQKFNQVLEIQKSKKVMTYIVLFIVRIKCLNLLDCLRIYHDSDIKQRTNQEKIKTSEVKVFLIHEIETCHWKENTNYSFWYQGLQPYWIIRYAWKFSFLLHCDLFIKYFLGEIHICLDSSPSNNIWLLWQLTWKQSNPSWIKYCIENDL